MHPTLYPASQIKDLIAHSSTRHGTAEELRHPIHIALDWQRDLAANKDLTMTRIARNKGIHPG